MDKLQEVKQELEGHILYENSRETLPVGFTKEKHEGLVLGLVQALSIINELK